MYSADTKIQKRKEELIMPKVYLSPSGQTRNTGVGNYGNEAERMQQLSNKVKALLQKKGYQVYGGDNTIGLGNRVKDSNTYGVDAHIALHSNAGTGTA